jgi:hypothetical protein
MDQQKEHDHWMSPNAKWKAHELFIAVENKLKKFKGEKCYPMNIEEL